jgi:riboflavin kinase/FMN adenylyltransferase|tara:strand:- start:311 stop:697 length:387 start_codon:yes stop_codon:yes gene_type:complete
MIFKSSVIHGSKHGESIGYPTANLKINQTLRYCLKKFGVYAVRVSIRDRIYKGALFWGKRTLFSDKDPVCEVLIIDFDDTLYGEEVEVEVIKYIRDIVNVENEQELKNLIQEDVQKIKLLFNNKNTSS